MRVVIVCAGVGEDGCEKKDWVVWDFFRVYNVFSSYIKFYLLQVSMFF